MFGVSQRVMMGAGGGGGDPAEITVNAVEFDGTNDYLTRDAQLTGIADSKSGIFSCWINKNGDGTADALLAIDSTVNSSGTDKFEIRIDANNSVIVIGRNAGGSVIVLTIGPQTVEASDGWVHILAAWDLAASKLVIYVDDAAYDDTPDTMTNDTINYAVADAGIGQQWKSDGDPDPATIFHGGMAELYFQDGEFLDLTEESNRRKFISSNGKPVDLGSDGSDPTGTQPVVYLTGATNAWHTNKGSGGGFTEVGALTTASSSPSD